MIESINSITRKRDESYETFVDRAAANFIGRHVKLSDLKDNSDLLHIANPTAQDHERIAKYHAQVKGFAHFRGVTYTCRSFIRWRPM